MGVIGHPKALPSPCQCNRIEKIQNFFFRSVFDNNLQHKNLTQLMNKDAIIELLYLTIFWLFYIVRIIYENALFFVQRKCVIVKFLIPIEYIIDDNVK